MKISQVALCLCAAGMWPAAAQGPVFDSSGNGLLNGTYYFREVFYLVGDNSGNLGQAISLYGNIAFDGNGNYSMVNATVMDSSTGTPEALSCYLSGNFCATSSTAVKGTYTIAASGYGYLSNPLSTGDFLYALVSNGVITGSTTEGGFNDLLIGAKLGSPTPGNATFQGSWTMAGFLPGGSPGNTADLYFPLNPDGNGNLGTVNIVGYYGNGGNKTLTQTTQNLKYVFTNGAGVITFPASTSAPYFAGQEYLYFSPDGNFVFGGSPTGYDMLVGIRNDAGSVTENFSGLYYQSGIDQNVASLGTNGFANLDTYYGSFGATGGSIVGAQRLQSIFNNNALTSTFTDTYPATITGGTTVNDGFTQYAYGNGGAVRIGAGIWPYLGLTVAFKSPVLTGSGVFLNPTGIANAASSAPFTAGIAPGELITLYGTNLASSTVVAPGIPFPPTLGGVQVTINGIPAPIYYVSPGQVSVIVPYGNTFSIAQIQVTNNGTPSNMVTEFVDHTAVGVFTVPPGGVGYGAMLHNATGALVTAANPAQPGEYVQTFVTGLGTVFPTIADGAAGSTTALNYSTYFSSDSTMNQIQAYIAGVQAPVVYAGLAPGLAGLYQINIQIPATGLTSGDNALDISGPDSYSAQAVIPIGTGAAAGAVTTSSAQPGARVRRGPAATRGPATMRAKRPAIARQ